MIRPKTFYLALLSHRLISLRAEADEGTLSIEKARAVADTLHNLPGALMLEWTDERDERAYGYIRSKAQTYGFDFDSWEKAAWSSALARGDNPTGSRESGE